MTDNSQSDHVLFMRLLSKHEPSVRAYVRAGVFAYQDVTEIMQEVSIVAWNKFDQLSNPEDGVGKWMCVIARYEILKFRQTKARDKIVLDDSVVEKLLNEGIEGDSVRSKWIEALDRCLEKLPAQKRSLILQAYDPANSIKDLAKQLRKTPDGLYQLLRRIRVGLASCVEKTMAKDSKSSFNFSANH